MNISLQKFLNYDNVKLCYSGKQNSKLKYNNNCVLRYGVNNNKNQSFLECIANMYNEINNQDDFVEISIQEKNNFTLEDLKNKIIKISPEQFLSCNKGNLVSIFYDKDIDISKVSMKKINNLSKEDTIRLYKAKENFINYIKNSNSYINYEYLWDMICSNTDKQGILFKKGVNLIILKNPNNDVVDKIELVCPITEYTENIFDSSKPSIILYSENDMYEPLYIVNNIQNTKKKNRYNIKKYFELSDLDDNVPELKNMFFCNKEYIIK